MSGFSAALLLAQCDLSSVSVPYVTVKGIERIAINRGLAVGNKVVGYTQFPENLNLSLGTYRCYKRSNLAARHNQALHCVGRVEEPTCDMVMTDEGRDSARVVTAYMRQGQVNRSMLPSEATGAAKTAPGDRSAS